LELNAASLAVAVEEISTRDEAEQRAHQMMETYEAGHKL
jgi:hypothetical protein